MKEAHQLLQSAPVSISSATSKDATCPPAHCDRGPIDVVVCDGFVGNVVLKFYEAIAPFIIGLLAQRRHRSESTMMGALKQLDYSEHGGAPLLGVQRRQHHLARQVVAARDQERDQGRRAAIESKMDEHIGRRLQEARARSETAS